MSGTAGSVLSAVVEYIVLTKSRHYFCLLDALNKHKCCAHIEIATNHNN